jgi:uncharacterized protein
MCANPTLRWSDQELAKAHRSLNCEPMPRYFFDTIEDNH